MANRMRSCLDCENLQKGAIYNHHRNCEKIITVYKCPLLKKRIAAKNVKRQADTCQYYRLINH